MSELVSEPKNYLAEIEQLCYNIAIVTPVHTFAAYFYRKNSDWETPVVFL
jgi:hypothetical protein